MRSAVDSHAAPLLLALDLRRGGRRAKMVNDQVMMRRALERRANRRGRVKGVKTFKHDDYDRFNYGGPFVHHFTREATRSLENHTRWEAVRAATLHVLNRTTLPRPPDQRAKCYLSGVGAEDIRPQLFRALPCGDEDTIIEAIGYIQ